MDSQHLSQATPVGRMQGLARKWKFGRWGSGKAPLCVSGKGVPCACVGLQSPGKLPLTRELGRVAGFGAAL